MKIEVQNPNIIRVAYHQEPGDHLYGSCLWAYYDFDLDKYMMNVQSDCGNAAYRWCATPKTERFLKLMARMNDDTYLVEKLYGDPKRVDVDATIKELREWLGIGEDEDLKDESISDDDREEMEAALEWLEGLLEDHSFLDKDTAEAIIENWNNEHEYELDAVYERIVTDYTAWEKRVVQIFIEHIRPKIAELATKEAV